VRGGHTWLSGKAPPLQPSSSKFATIAVSCGIAGLEGFARLGTARANALQVMTSQGADADAAHTRALTAYKGFLTLRKEADRDVSTLIPMAAKAAYAKPK